MKSCRFLALLAVCVLAQLSMAAQTAVTSVHGVIADQSGALVPNAHVSLSNPETGFKAERVSDPHGEYAFEQIAPGKYTILAQSSGFSTQREVVDLLVNQARTLDFKLTVAANNVETVDVVDNASTLNLADATVGTPFDTPQIQALPFEGNNVLDLLSLQAGVLFLGDKPSTAQDSDSRSGSVDGARSDQSNVTLAGLDDNDQNKGYAYTGVLRSTRDSVEEFRVVTSNANADSGRSSGAQVSLVTRGGTNHLHGSLYEFYRPTDTVANDWFNKEAELSNNLPNIPPKLLRNTFGGSVGGPVLRDKLFYFMTFEGQRLAESSQISNTVPTDAFRQGNLSYINSTGTVTTLDPAQIASMDPKCSANGTCPLGPGVNSAVTSYFAHFPSPNINAGGSGDDYNQQVYTFSSPAPQVLNTYIAKVDYDINSRHRVFVRGNLQGDNVASAEQFPHGIPDSELYSNNKGIAAG